MEKWNVADHWVEGYSPVYVGRKVCVSQKQTRGGVAVHKTGGREWWGSDEIGSSDIAFLGLLK